MIDTQFIFFLSVTNLQDQVHFHSEYVAQGISSYSGSWTLSPVHKGLLAQTSLIIWLILLSGSPLIRNQASSGKIFWDFLLLGQQSYTSTITEHRPRVQKLCQIGKSPTWGRGVQERSHRSRPILIWSLGRKVDGRALLAGPVRKMMGLVWTSICERDL